jgi:hypothetical protein
VPGLATLTDDVLSGDVWTRPGLSPRDRSLVTMAALAAMGDDDQLNVYLRRGVESGLTRAQIEALTHQGFYAPADLGQSSGRTFVEGGVGDDVLRSFPKRQCVVGKCCFIARLPAS